MSQTPPGWYPEPAGGMRWWDGTQWTEQRAAAAPDSPLADGGPDVSGAPGVARTAPRRSHLPLIWGGIAFVAIAAVAVVVVVLTRGDDDGPARTIDAFIAATNEADCARAVQFLTSDRREDSSTDEDCQATDDEGNVLKIAFTADEVTVDDGTATVHGHLRDTAGTYQPETWDDVVFTLVQEDGAWAIDDLAFPDDEDVVVE